MRARVWLAAIFSLAGLACADLTWAADPTTIDLTIPSDLDTDGDLMPDAWEQAHGLDSANPSDAELDPDGDRLSNRDEWFAETDPAVYTGAAAMSERQLLDLFKGKAFLYFWEQSRSPYYFTPDKANYNDRADYTDGFNSIATTGFGMLSIVAADERGWAPHVAAYQRIRKLLARAVALQDPAYDQLGVPTTQQGNRHGYLYHFVDNNGFRHPGSEISTIDHALFAAGALVAAEYYKGTKVETLARKLVQNTDWNWLYDGTFLYQGWLEDPQGSFEGGRTLDAWNRYSELMILMFLAMGHPDADRAIPASAWDALAYGTARMFPFEYAHLVPGDAAQNFAFVPSMPNTIDESGFRNSATELHYIHAGSLHNHQYSHLFADFRARRDRYQTDFFANSISATMANRQYCINLNSHAFGGDPASPDPYLRQPYETYEPDSWGLMAGIPSFTGYAVLQPIVMSWDNFSPENISVNNDGGTVVLNASLGSTPFTPRQTLDFLRNMLRRFQANESGYDALIGRYGFRNAFNLGRTDSGQLGHFPAQTIGLDLGPAVGSVENFESGLIWKFAMRNEFLERGMQAAGFPTGNVEPFILNFDDNPPAPHEDPNGGGQDPNSFGGTSYAWGSGTVAYTDIGDPFPDLPFGPQQWAQRISVSDGTASGAFALLRNHSVSRWDRLSFWIRGETGDETYEVGLKDSVVDRLGNALQPTEVKLSIAAYHPSGKITTNWTEVRVPLRDFADSGVRLTALDNISFTNISPNGGAILVDDIAFLGDEFAPQAPQELAATTDGASVTLTWKENPEPDVVGYRIYQSLDGGATFTRRKKQLVVPPVFKDQAVAHGAYHYYVTAVDNAQPQNESAPSTTVSIAVNRAPVLAAIGDRSTNEGQSLTGDVSATDPDGDVVQLFARQANGDPLSELGAVFTDHGDGTGTLTWKPTFVQAGSYPVTFSATDSFGLSDDETITVTVVEALAPPPVVSVTTPVLSTVVDRTKTLEVAGTATAAAGGIVTSPLTLLVDDVTVIPPASLLSQSVPVSSGASVSWTTSVPPNLAPGHKLRIQVKALSDLTGEREGIATFYIRPDGKIVACYILTAAYGSPYASEIQVLHEFRERFIPMTPLHRLLLDWYDRIGPPAAAVIQRSPLLRALVRRLAAPLVAAARRRLSS